jgi:hypothetical protein
LPIAQGWSAACLEVTFASKSPYISFGNRQAELAQSGFAIRVDKRPFLKITDTKRREGLVSKRRDRPYQGEEQTASGDGSGDAQWPGGPGSPPPKAGAAFYQAARKVMS